MSEEDHSRYRCDFAFVSLPKILQNIQRLYILQLVFEKFGRAGSFCYDS